MRDMSAEKCDEHTQEPERADGDDNRQDGCHDGLHHCVRADPSARPELSLPRGDHRLFQENIPVAFESSESIYEWVFASEARSLSQTAAIASALPRGASGHPSIFPRRYSAGVSG